MAVNVTPAMVRARLDALEYDVSNKRLDVHLIDQATSFVTLVLSNASKDITALTSDQDNVAEMAIIAKVCMQVVSSAPVEDHEMGPVKVKGVRSENKKAIVDILEKEYLQALYVLGVGAVHIDYSDYEATAYEYSHKYNDLNGAAIFVNSD